MLRKLLKGVMPALGKPRRSHGHIDGVPARHNDEADRTWSRQKNTLVCTCTRVDGQYVIRETLASGLKNPFYLITSRSRAHFEALFSTSLEFTHRFIVTEAVEDPLPGTGFDPLAGCASDDEVIEALNAFEPMGTITEQTTRLALAWLDRCGARPSVPALIRLIATHGDLNPDCTLPLPQGDIGDEVFRATHLMADGAIKPNLAGACRYFDELNAALGHPWMKSADCAAPVAGVVVLVDKGNRAHAFQMHGILRDMLRRKYQDRSPSPILVIDEADRFIAPGLLLSLVLSEKTRVVLIPEIADRILGGDSGERLVGRFEKFVWFRTHSGAGRELYEKLHRGKSSVVGSAHDITCATLNLNTRITLENGVSTFENLAAKSGVIPREPAREAAPKAPHGKRGA